MKNLRFNFRVIFYAQKSIICGIKQKKIVIFFKTPQLLYSNIRNKQNLRFNLQNKILQPEKNYLEHQT